VGGGCRRARRCSSIGTLQKKTKGGGEIGKDPIGRHRQTIAAANHRPQKVNLQHAAEVQKREAEGRRASKHRPLSRGRLWLKGLTRGHMIGEGVAEKS